MIEIRKGAKKPWKTGDLIQVAANKGNRDYPYRVKFNGKIYAVQSVSLEEAKLIGAPMGLSNGFCTYALEGTATPAFKKTKVATSVSFDENGMRQDHTVKKIHLGFTDRYAIL